MPDEWKGHEGAMRVADACVREVRTSAPDQSVAQLARAMQGEGVGTHVVVDPVGRPLGLVTDRDVALRCVVEGRDPRRIRAEQIMSGPVAWIHEEQMLETALLEMARLRVRRLAVVDARERLVGMLALDDVLCLTFDETSPIGKVLRATVERPGSASGS
jgi:signal-transduction protein with cAMP-binding, CBS, and nucleotidyltransferase domain